MTSPAAKLTAVRAALLQAFPERTSQVHLLLTALLSGGHVLIEDTAAEGRDLLLALDGLIGGDAPDALTHIRCDPSLAFEDVLPLLAQGDVVVVDHLNRASRRFQLLLGQLVASGEVLVPDPREGKVRAVRLPEVSLIAARVKHSEGGVDAIPLETGGNFLFHLEFGTHPDAAIQERSDLRALARPVSRARFEPLITTAEVLGLRTELAKTQPVDEAWDRTLLALADQIRATNETERGGRPAVGVLRQVREAHAVAAGLRGWWSESCLFAAAGARPLGGLAADEVAFLVAGLGHRSMRRAGSPYSGAGVVRLALKQMRPPRADAAQAGSRPAGGDSAAEAAAQRELRELEAAYGLYREMHDYLAKVVHGRGEGDDLEEGQRGLGTLNLLLASLLGGGHFLLEDFPGTGKTFMVKKLAEMVRDDSEEPGIRIDGFRRIQCVPDLMPGDLTGYEVLVEGRTLFRKGPVFAHVLLLDEINRTSPKVQAAMLEAMAESQVTVGDRTYPLGRLFFVVATQNPYDAVGTFPLTAAQLDRFLFKRRLKPVKDAFVERIIFDQSEKIAPPAVSVPAITRAVQAIHGSERLANEKVMGPLLRNLAALFQEAVLEGKLREGSKPSPRSLKQLLRALKVVALIRSGGKNLADCRVQPEHLSQIAVDFFSHRIAGSEREGGDDMPLDRRQRLIEELVQRALREPHERERTSYPGSR